MKLQYKKYLYLLNDLTGMLLKKDMEDHIKMIKNLRLSLYVVCVFLVISILVNIYLFLN
jgi:hypothetical protein